MTDISIDFKTGKLATIILNAPDRLNALDMAMIVPLGNQLAQWRDDENVHAVLIKGAGDKAFCAGGDVVAVCELMKTDMAQALLFFWSEYGTNWRIKNFPKPYIAIMDGFVMGGGVGVSVHGSYRIVTEKTMLAMPETNIGFYPDVGGSYFLPKLQSYIGMYLGLTGHRLRAADLIELGIATHYINSNDLPNLEAALMDADFNNDAFAMTEEILSQFCEKPVEKSTLLEIEDQINQVFGGETLVQIFENLGKQDTNFTQKTLKVLSRMSPTSLQVTFAQLTRAKGMSFDAVMQQEMRITRQMMMQSDFHEGVRALLVDKDKNPNWQIKSIEDVTQSYVNEYFSPIDNELFFDWNKPVDFVGY